MTHFYILQLGTLFINLISLTTLLHYLELWTVSEIIIYNILNNYYQLMTFCLLILKTSGIQRDIRFQDYRAWIQGSSAASIL